MLPLEAPAATDAVPAAGDARRDRLTELELLQGDRDDVQLERARSLAAIDHQNIVRVFGAERLGGRVFLIVERIDGRSLDELLAVQHGLEPAAVVEIVRAVADALTVLHQAGGVHGGVDPSNIVRESETGRVVLRGLAGWVDGLEWLDVQLVAALRQDLYGLAATAFELLTGRPVGEEDWLAALVDAHALEQPPSASAIRPGLPWRVDRVLASVLNGQPAGRTGTPVRFADDLADALRIGDAQPRILVADDDDDQRQLLALALTRALGPIELDSASDGERAYGAALERAPDLAVLDLDMPGMNGLELAAALRSLPRLDRLPIVIVSGGIGPMQQEVLARIGVDRCIAKPAPPSRVASAARELLAGDWTARPQAGATLGAQIATARVRDEAG